MSTKEITNILPKVTFSKWQSWDLNQGTLVPEHMSLSTTFNYLCSVFFIYFCYRDTSGISLFQVLCKTVLGIWRRGGPVLPTQRTVLFPHEYWTKEGLVRSSAQNTQDVLSTFEDTWFFIDERTTQILRGLMTHFTRKAKLSEVLFHSVQFCS